MRKFLVFVAGAVLLFLLFATVISSVMVLTVTPNHIKQWLKNGGVYSAVIDNLTKQGQTAVAETSGQPATQDNSAEVKAALQKTLTPAFLQTSTEHLIDGVTPWLEGKTPTPRFAIDVSGVKQSFIEELANQARTRYAALPPCAKGQIPDTSDIFNVSCQVPGVSIEPQIQQAVQDFNVNKDFLPNAVITADNLKTGKDGQQKPIFDQFHDVPKYYQWAHIAPFILGALTLLCALIIILASTEKRAGAKRIMIAVGGTGIILLVVVWASGYGVRQAQDHLAKMSSDNSVVQNSAIQVIKLVRHDANTNILMFAAVFLVIALGLLVYLLLSRPKKPRAPDAPPRPPAPDNTPPAAPAKRPPTLVQITV